MRSSGLYGFLYLTLTVYRYLKTVIIMAKYDLKFIANDDENTNISVKKEDLQIVIKTESECDSITICLDKSTAIKLAKTLRTEINKITESEVKNG